MARRATYLKQHHAGSEHRLVVDNGDFISGRGKKEQLAAEYLLKAFAKMEYDAINLGERDFLLGLQFLKDMEKKYKLSFVSANIFYSDGVTPVFQPYIIKELKGFDFGDSYIPAVKVGIFGVMMERQQLSYHEADPRLVVGDPIAAAQNAISKLKDRCDLIVGLIHLSYGQLTAFAEAVPEIDVIIAGHDAVMRIDPQKINQSLVIMGGNRGQYIGDLRLVLNQQKKIIDYEGKVVALDAKIKDDPAMLKLIQEYSEQEAKLSFEINREQYQKIEMYMGAAKCKECHQEQYEQWSKTPHASAFNRLVQAGKKDDINCARCHTTGFGLYNGFYGLDESPDMIHVQCEACHGIGKLHVQSIEKIKSQQLKAAILAPITEETCVGCHDKTQDPTFDYQKDLKLVKH